MITKTHQIPFNSLLQKKGEQFNYIVSFQAVIADPNQHVDVAKVLHLFINSSPKWADHLMSLRDRIVGVFGLKTMKQFANGQEPQRPESYEVGQRLGLFVLYAKTENEYVMGEDDKHLTFRVSLLVELLDGSTGKKRISITTAVKFLNLFGRLYFLPVKPFHGLIVGSTLKRMKWQLENEINGL